MKWKKLGRIFDAPPLCPKLLSHAANPLAVQISSDVYRVFFSGRDQENRSSVGFFDFDMSRLEIVYVHQGAVLQHGERDSFYSHGISLGCEYSVDGVRYLLFMGWKVPDSGHWFGEIGRLRITPDNLLTLDSNEPFLALDTHDRLSLSYPWVKATGDGYEMWYGSTVEWALDNGEMLHILKAATSRDGMTWKRSSPPIPYEKGVAQAFSRPTLLSDAMGDHMWFSYRSGQKGATYRIGYAHRAGEEAWKLKLASSGVDVSDEGWDSQMIEYPFVFRFRESIYMLYNGNSYGKTGIGLAVLSVGNE